MKSISTFEKLMSLIPERLRENDIIEIQDTEGEHEAYRFLEETGVLRFSYGIDVGREMRRNRAGESNLWYKRDNQTWIVMQHWIRNYIFTGRFEEIV